MNVPSIEELKDKLLTDQAVAEHARLVAEAEAREKAEREAAEIEARFKAVERRYKKAMAVHEAALDELGKAAETLLVAYTRACGAQKAAFAITRDPDGQWRLEAPRSEQRHVAMAKALARVQARDGHTPEFLQQLEADVAYARGDVWRHVHEVK